MTAGRLAARSSPAAPWAAPTRRAGRRPT
jgi:hypothetical protein